MEWLQGKLSEWRGWGSLNNVRVGVAGANRWMTLQGSRCPTSWTHFTSLGKPQCNSTGRGNEAGFQSGSAGRTSMRVITAQDYSDKYHNVGEDVEVEALPTQTNPLT